MLRNTPPPLASNDLLCCPKQGKQFWFAILGDSNSHVRFRVISADPPEMPSPGFRSRCIRHPLRFKEIRGKNVEFLFFGETLRNLQRSLQGEHRRSTSPWQCKNFL